MAWEATYQFKNLQDAANSGFIHRKICVDPP
jgi:hypothetical protein